MCFNNFSVMLGLLCRIQEVGFEITIFFAKGVFFVEMNDCLSSLISFSGLDGADVLSSVSAAMRPLRTEIVLFRSATIARNEFFYYRVLFYASSEGGRARIRVQHKVPSFLLCDTPRGVHSIEDTA